MTIMSINIPSITERGYIRKEHLTDKMWVSLILIQSPVASIAQNPSVLIDGLDEYNRVWNLFILIIRFAVDFDMPFCLSICLVEMWGFNTVAPKTTNEVAAFGPDFCHILFKLSWCAFSVSFLMVFLHR